MPETTAINVIYELESINRYQSSVSFERVDNDGEVANDHGLTIPFSGWENLGKPYKISAVITVPPTD